MKLLRVVCGLFVVAGIASGVYADWTPAHTAADEGDTARLSKLLKRKPALAKAKDVGDHTPLHVAAWSGHPGAADVLLANGADVNAQDSCGWTPLHTAANRNKKSVAALLLAKGADVNAKDKREQTPLRLAVKYGNNDLAELLREHGGHE